MLSEASRRLEADHHSLGKLLSTLPTTWTQDKVKTAHDGLDLFWARLAVHIRAEHLHLFPSILSASLNSRDLADGPSLKEAEATIQELVNDHDFFMRELSSAIMVLRETLTLDDRMNLEKNLAHVSEIVGRVERRLQTHNQLEEETIYRWAGSLLDEERQSVLALEVEENLRKRPARFDSVTWEKP